MYVAQLDLSAFDWAPAEQLAPIVESLTTALARCNAVICKRRQLPALYQSGVRYRLIPSKDDRYRDVLQVLHSGYGDCEDLAAFRAGELLAQGIPATIQASVEIDTPRLIRFHLTVNTPWGNECPSTRLGMK